MDSANRPEPPARIAPSDSKPAKTIDLPAGPCRIVSGGQTGVDRAALDAAIQLGIEHGGWCPRNRRAEDGPIHGRYQLRETKEWEYRFRTERNVVESDATLILYHTRIVGGTALTRNLASQHQRPCWCVDLGSPPIPGLEINGFAGLAIGCLNVAGPRESTSPGIYALALSFLIRWLPEGTSC